MKYPIPYHKQNKFSLQLNDGSCIEAEILKLRADNFSVVLVVSIKDDGWPGTCIVKLYDRRYAADLRDQEGGHPWDDALEQEYQKLVLNGQAQSMFAYWTEHPTEKYYWNDPAWDQDDLAQREVWLQFQSWKIYSTETHAYDLMHDLQGHRIPKLLGRSTSISALPPDVDSSAVNRKLLGIPGIVLELIDGFSLRDILTYSLLEFHQEIGDQAIDIVTLLGQHGVCNQDVRLENFIVGEDGPLEFHVFMIDFGLCRFRDQAKSDAEFEQWQAKEDEEGQVGYVLQSDMRVDFAYHRSARARGLEAKYKGRK